jgi:hypothetical protein
MSSDLDDVTASLSSLQVGTRSRRGPSYPGQRQFTQELVDYKKVPVLYIGSCKCSSHRIGSRLFLMRTTIVFATGVTRLGENSPNGRLFILGSFFISEVGQNFSYFSKVYMDYALILTKKWVGLYFGRFFH